MTPAKIILRLWGDGKQARYWCAVRRVDPEDPRDVYAQVECYDTPGFGTAAEALKQARAFCKWRGWRVRKIWGDL